MGCLRKHIGVLLMLVFCSYYAGINLFSHTHISNGSPIVHSHLGGSSEHDHSDGQYVAIDILSNFQSEQAVDYLSISAPFIQSCELCIGYAASAVTGRTISAHTLRGPPQANTSLQIFPQA